MTTILKLQTANVKRIHVVEITPEGDLVTIGGANGAGKSSVLDSIEYALGGAKAIPAKPLRRGARKGRTIVTLSNGLTVARTYTDKGSSIVVTGPDGETVASPQTMLDKLAGELSFDPLAYARMKPAEQAATLRRLVGLDTSAIDRERQDAYDARTEAGREVKRLTAQLSSMRHDPGAPAEVVSIQELGDQLAAAQNVVSENERAVARAQEQARDAARQRDRQRLMVDACARQRQDIEAMRERLAAMERQLETSLVETETDDARVTALEQAAAEAVAAATALVAPDTTEIRQRLRDADETNARVRANAARETVRKTLAEAEKRHEGLAAAIEEIDERKGSALAAAKFPVPGLGFDPSGVTLDGLPFEQASQAERLRVSVAMGLALNPELRVLLVRDGSLLDAASLRMVAEMASGSGAQVWLEMVSDTGEGCQVVIEDGYVRGGPAAGAEG